MTKAFASLAGLAAKKISFIKLSANEYAFTAEEDPNTGVIVDDDEVGVIDAHATPKMAHEVIKPAHKITDKPSKHVVASHYHAVRARRACAYAVRARRACAYAYKGGQVISGQASPDLIHARGNQDVASGTGRFPRLFAVPSQSPA